MPEAFPEMPNYQQLDKAKDGIRDVVQLIDALKQKYPIDDKRVYVVGCAEGGFGAFGAALRYPGVFAASVPVNSGWAAEDAKGFSKVPLWVFHGANDTTYSAQLSRDAASYIDAYGGKATYTEVPNVGHDCMSDQFYLPQMWDWLFQQHK
jgi:predicted peptidase